MNFEKELKSQGIIISLIQMNFLVINPLKRRVHGWTKKCFEIDLPQAPVKNTCQCQVKLLLIREKSGNFIFMTRVGTL